MNCNNAHFCPQKTRYQITHYRAAVANYTNKFAKNNAINPLPIFLFHQFWFDPLLGL